MIDERPGARAGTGTPGVAGGLFYLPNGGADAVLHFGTSAIFLAGAAHYYASERGRVPGRARTGEP